MATSVSMMHHRYFAGPLQMGNSSLYTRHKRPQQKRVVPSSFHGAKTMQQQGVNETLKEAALINIVAAVNEDQVGDRGDFNAVPGSAIDSLSNTMAVISNLMNSRNRTVSIPKTSKVSEAFNLTKNTTQKKPVYYKHSDNVEVARGGQNHMAMLNHMQDMDEQGTNSIKNGDKRKFGNEVMIRALPVRTHTVEYNSMHNLNYATGATQKKQTNKSASKDRESVSRSSVRKLGSIKRTVHKIPKCDAVDFSDNGSNQNLQEFFKVLYVTDKQNENSSTSKGKDVKYYRTKSLPAMFPTKATPKEVTNTPIATPRTRTSVSRGRLHSRGTLRTQKTPDSLYQRALNMPSGFGFEKLAIYNGLNQNPDIVSPVEHDSKKPPSTKHSFSGIVTQRSSWKQRSPKYPHLSQTYKDEGGDDVFLAGKRMFMTECNEDFREAVRSAMNGAIDQQYEEVVYSVTPSGISSGMDIHNPQHNGKDDRHVQFTRRRYLSESSDESIQDDKQGEEDAERISTPYQDARMIHAPVSTSVSYSPVSASQLLRIKQKIIPANIKTDAPTFQPYFSTTSGMVLQKLDRQRSDATNHSRSKSFVNSETNANDDVDVEVKVTEIPKIVDEPPMKHEEKRCESKAEFTDLRDIACSPVGRDVSKAHAGLADRRSDDDASFYKLVKAVDTHSYAEYEHKKLRRLPPGVCGKALDHQTTEFVKVKL